DKPRAAGDQNCSHDLLFNRRYTRINADEKISNLKISILICVHPRSSAVSKSLNEFDIVPERITKMKTFVARDLRLLLDRQTGRLDFPAPGGDVVDLISQVR